MSNLIIDAKGVVKNFGGVRALKGVDLQIKKGEVHCLAGENGSGKSTIIKTLSGVHTPDGGSFKINGTEYDSITPIEAINEGIQIIYQDFSVFPNLTVIENLALNKVLAEKKKFVNRREFRKIAEEAVSKINFDVDLDAKVETLSVADKQLIAISRALLDDAQLIVMDEPTTALTKTEVNRLFDIISDLKANGVTILFVSHKLDEVFEISDSITIFRNGQNVISCPIDEIDEDKFAYHMTGRKIEQGQSRTKETKGDVVLETKDLSGNGFRDINLQLKKGEILGVTGQLGSGRTQLSLALFGMMQPSSGKILLDGEEVNVKSSTVAQDLGIALVPEDRLTEGLFLPQSIRNNITITTIDDMVNKMGLIDDKVLEETSDFWVKSLGVATDNDEYPVATLSGGNQQKVLLAREIAKEPKVLILNGPTVGVDIGAKHDIHNLLHKLTEEDMGIIVVSDDASEIINLCDRLLILEDGEIIKELDESEINADDLMEYI